MSEINVVHEVQRRVQIQMGRLRQELVDAGLHPLEAEAITVENKGDGVVVTVGKVTAAAKKAYDRAQEEAQTPPPTPVDREGETGFRLDESRLDVDAVLGDEDDYSNPDSPVDEGPEPWGPAE